MKHPDQQLELTLVPECPKCAAEMRLRTSQYGDFWSCSRYPDCNGKRNGNYNPAQPQPTAQPARRSSTAVTPANVVGSPEQAAIWAAITDGSEHVQVQALAGTGKSFTCRHAMALVPSNLRVLYLAFNKSIATEFAQGAPRNAEVRTLNAMGWRVVKNAFPNAVLDNDKVVNLLSEIYTPSNPEQIANLRTLQTAVEKLVALCQAYLLTPDGPDGPESLLDLASHHEVEIDGSIQDQVLSLVPQVLRLSRERPSVVNFSDQLWLPVVLNLPAPKYDLIFVDESQDLNRVQHHLVLRLLAPAGRVVMVGDEFQAIYGFRGSDVESMRNFAELLLTTGKPVISLPLTVTRRCPVSVVQEAQAYVPALDHLPDAPPGKVTYSDLDRAESLYRVGDMVLCRCNAPLVGVAFRLIRKGTRAVIRGRDIGQGLITLVQKLRPTDLNDLLRKLDGWSQKEIAKLAGTRREESMVQNILDRAECLQVLAEDCETVTELVARIGAIFDNVGDDGLRNAVVLSSIHRAKGLEADRVFWLLPEIQCRASQEWQQTQERNLRYVAITRAKQELVYVHDYGYEPPHTPPYSSELPSILPDQSGNGNHLTAPASTPEEVEEADDEYPDDY